MARRVTAVVAAGVLITIVLWLATGPSASGFVKSALFAIVGSILVLYKFDDLAARFIGTTSAVETPPPAPTGGVFDTDLPAEAFADPVIESKLVHLSRSTSTGSNGSSLLVFGETEEAEPDLDPPETQLIFVNDEEVDQSELDLPEVETTPIFERKEEALVANDRETEAVVASEPTFIQLADYSNDDLVASVRAGEASLVSVLTDSGMLSTEGPLTDTDVATMVFVAVSSDDLLRVLLAGKQAEAEAKALSYAPDTPELYQPAPELVELEG